MRSLRLSWTVAVGCSLLAAAACESSPEIRSDVGSNSGDGDGDGAKKDGDTAGGVDAGALGGGGESGSGAQGGGLGGATACAEEEEDADLIPANLLFVVDKSGSMNCNEPSVDPLCSSPAKVDMNSDSKWEITQKALTGDGGALETLAGQPGISVGLMTFPTNNYCAVPAEGEVAVPIAAMDEAQLALLTTELTSTAQGQTPLAGATIRGLQALRKGIETDALNGDNYLVVMTDGAETCQPSEEPGSALQNLRRFVEDAQEHYGIQTYVIGAPGSEGARELLSEIAILGGTRSSDQCVQAAGNATESCHIDLTESTDFAADLGAEFSGITEATTQTCEYDVPSNALADPELVNVEFTPGEGEKSQIPQDVGASDEQCDDADGWQFTQDGKQIVLCGPACDAVKADPEAKVRVVFGCRKTAVRPR